MKTETTDLDTRLLSNLQGLTGEEGRVMGEEEEPDGDTSLKDIDPEAVVLITFDFTLAFSRKTAARLFSNLITDAREEEIQAMQSPAYPLNDLIYDIEDAMAILVNAALGAVDLPQTKVEVSDTVDLGEEEEEDD